MKSRITGTGAGDGGSTAVTGGTVDWAFSPADGPAIDSRYAALVDAATTRVVVASMVLTSPTILTALVTAARRGP